MAFVPVSLTECQKRVAMILNAGPDDGTYAAASTDQMKYPAGEITDAILEVDLEVCRTILNSLGNGYRVQYVQVVAQVDGQIPFHPGKIMNVLVQRDALNIPGKLAPSLDALMDWKNDSTLFPDATGYYYITEEAYFYFIGTSASITIANDLVNTGACQAPIVYTATVIRGAVSLLAKDGVNMDMIHDFYAQYQRDLEVIKSGNAPIPELEAFKRAGAS